MQRYSFTSADSFSLLALYRSAYAVRPCPWPSIHPIETRQSPHHALPTQWGYLIGEACVATSASADQVSITNIIMSGCPDYEVTEMLPAGVPVVGLLLPQVEGTSAAMAGFRQKHPQVFSRLFGRSTTAMVAVCGEGRDTYVFDEVRATPTVPACLHASACV